MKSNNGLTLIELLIVMSLISILAVAMWGNFFTSLTKGRDSRRKQDLEAVSKSIELFYNDSKSYPQPTQIIWGTVFANPSNSSVIYMQKLPTDPASPTYDYCYDSDGSYYKLYANLENLNDPKIIPTVACSSVNYNYGISSPNVTP